MNLALIIAGGKGERMNQDIPKQFLNVYDKPVIIYTLEAFQRHTDIDAIAVVCISGWEQVLAAYAKQFKITKLKHIVAGGDCGQASIKNGLIELKKYYLNDDIVLIHDAIRPMISQEIISKCIETVKRYGSAIVAIPCAEAMLETNDRISANSSYPRDQLMRTQTPQAFPLGTILNAHERAKELGITNSVASCTLMVELGEKVYFSPGSEKNIKLTTTDDLEIFKALLVSKKDNWLK
ncbi:MAG: IspD/TarI family cytidylyltransferase [Dethiobacteraceae bacterium]|jgi:2-C-methyl-D-erythritol 4-phosphate cytidylyltransferase